MLYNSSRKKISYARHVWPLYGSEAFLQLIKFDDVSKARTQLCNRLSQGGLVLFFRANLLWIWREIPEFMFEIRIEHFCSVSGCASDHSTA